MKSIFRRKIKYIKRNVQKNGFCFDLETLLKKQLTTLIEKPKLRKKRVICEEDTSTRHH